jgi:ABC-type sugar transport system ATPase subunit
LATPDSNSVVGHTATAAPPAAGRVLDVRGLSRSFPGVRALVDVDFDLERGEIHALLGENGAGKSTLIKILAGLFPPDAGEIILRGVTVKLPSAQAALQAGISAVHQEFNYCPDLNAIENLYLGRSLPVNRLGLVDWPAARRRAQEVFASLGVCLDMDAPLHALSATNRKLVEIARGLVFKADILILDEPTAALPEDEVERFFQVIKRLKDLGVSVIYISHRLAEVFEIADRVTVLRDGHKIGTRRVTELTTDTLITMMVGRSLDTLFPKQEVAIGGPILTVRSLSRQRAFADVSFELRRGEILGVAGLVGAGRSELGQAIAGMFPADDGEIFLDGTQLRVRNVQDAMRAGIVYLPEDRQHQGLVLGMSIADNMTLPMLRTLSRGPLLQDKAQMAVAQEYRERLRVVCTSLRQPVGRLSGGNQQKCVLAKWMMTHPRVLVLDEPTRGIDVGAKAEVHALMSVLAGEGMGILMISSDLPEILGMSDRILVLHEGRLTAEFRPGEADQEAILRAATGMAGPVREGENSGCV